MSTTVNAFARASILLRAGLAGGALAQSGPILHLRPGATGSLQGTLEPTLGAQSGRVSLEDLEVSGTTFSYTTANAKQFRGTLTSDHQTIVGDAGNPTWTREKSQ